MKKETTNRELYRDAQNVEIKKWDELGASLLHLLIDLRAEKFIVGDENNWEREKEWECTLGIFSWKKILN